MANLVQWNTTSTSPLVNFMTTTIATLTTGTLSAVSSVTQVNSSQKRVYCDAELLVGTTVGPFGTGASFNLYAVPLVGSAAAETNVTQLQPMAVFPVTTSTSNSQHRITRTLITVSPADFTVALENQTTQALSTGSGANTLGLAFYDINLNA